MSNNKSRNINAEENVKNEIKNALFVTGWNAGPIDDVTDKQASQHTVPSTQYDDYYYFLRDKRSETNENRFCDSEILEMSFLYEASLSVAPTTRLSSSRHLFITVGHLMHLGESLVLPFPLSLSIHLPRFFVSLLKPISLPRAVGCPSEVCAPITEGVTWRHVRWKTSVVQSGSKFRLPLKLSRLSS